MLQRLRVQARAVSDGLPGDIVALALPLDVDKICEAGLIAPGWQQRFPNRSVVAESVVALVTRKGNPKNIRGWDDLTRQAHTVSLSCLVPIFCAPRLLGVRKTIGSEPVNLILQSAV